MDVEGHSMKPAPAPDMQAGFTTPDAPKRRTVKPSSDAEDRYNADLQARFHPGTTADEWIAYFAGRAERPNAEYKRPVVERVAVTYHCLLIRQVGGEWVAERVTETVWRLKRD